MDMQGVRIQVLQANVPLNTRLGGIIDAIVDALCHLAELHDAPPFRQPVSFRPRRSFSDQVRPLPAS
jgi:hypothetical protein